MSKLSYPVLLLSPIFAALALCCFTQAGPAPAELKSAGKEGAKEEPIGPKPDSYWNVDDVRTGMKGVGRTVMKGTKVEEFQAEVLGVLKNTSPGRDLVLARLSGLGLDKTGVIAGMSGSPVYLDGKLLGAVAYAWAYGKEPIAGITPFSQMYGCVEAQERRDLAEEGKPVKLSLARPLALDGKEFGHVTVAQGPAGDAPTESDGLWLTPLTTPLCASGFTPHSLKLLRDRVGGSGLLPMQSGSASGKVAEAEKDAVLEPGGPLAVSLISGDFDLSGIGTVTHVEGNRVYGWGHPFMSLGGCDMPMMTGYIHTVYPRQTVSFKMGSPLRAVGVVNADVSTCIAGTVGKKPDLLPVRMTVLLGDKGTPKTFNVQVARQRSLLAALVFTALTNSVDMEGDLPEEMTADMTVRIEVDGQAPIVVKDTFSGFSGGRAPNTLYGLVSQIVSVLCYNPDKPLRIKSIDCETRVTAGRRSADIEAVELASDVYAPGDTLKATVFVRPFRGQRQRVAVELKLPADLPEGSYSVTACDEPFCARQVLREDPNLSSPQTAAKVMESVQQQLAAKRTNLALRLPLGPSGVALNGKSLPNLPGSAVQILGNSRRTGAQAVAGSLTSRQPTEWVVFGAETVRFTVAKNTKTTRGDE